MGRWKTYLGGQPVDANELADVRVYDTYAEILAAIVGWGFNEIGREFVCLATGYKYYWNGAALVPYPSTGGAGAPVDKSYVTINDESAVLTGSVQHANIVDQAQLHEPKLHHASHQNVMADEINVTGLSGVLADEQNAGLIKAKTVDAPVAGDDLMFLQYNHGAGKFQLSAVGGGGDMTKAAYDTTTTNTKVDTALNAEKLNGQAAAFYATATHKDTHKTGGGANAFLVTDLLDGIARVTARANSGANTGSRRRLNFLDSATMAWTLSDVGANEEITISGAATASPANLKLLPFYTVWNDAGTYRVIADDGTEATNSANAVTAINWALASCDAGGGGLVYLKPGTYTINTGTLNVGKTTKLIGQGMMSTKLDVTAAINAITLDSAEEYADLGVEGLEIDLNGNNGHGIYASNLAKTDGICESVIQNLYIHDVNNGYCGAYLRNIFNTHISNLRIRTAGVGLGIYCDAAKTIHYGNSTIDNLRIGLTADNSTAIDIYSVTYNAGNYTPLTGISCICGSHAGTYGLRIRGDNMITVLGGTFESAEKSISIEDSKDCAIVNAFIVSKAGAGNTALYLSGESIRNRIIGSWVAGGDSAATSLDDVSNPATATNSKNWSLGTYYGEGVMGAYAGRMMFRGCQIWKTGVANPDRRSENYLAATGTGAQQSVAHGLGKTPTVILLSNDEDAANPYKSAASDTTYIYITAASGKDWQAYVAVGP